MIRYFAAVLASVARPPAPEATPPTTATCWLGVAVRSMWQARPRGLWD